ncbi:MAG: hypothetical protein P8X42_04230 [Calditrichaceae bacterium]|jgi:hypothetical protein
MKDRMDRKQFVIGTAKQLEKSDIDYWANTTIEEKLQTITYLRECFYGKNATTGRLQRVYTIFKRI